MLYVFFLFKEIPPVNEDLHVNMAIDNETSVNGFIKYLDFSKTPLCVSIKTCICFFRD